MAQTFQAIHSGMTHIEVGQILRELFARNGGEKVTWMGVAAGVYPGPGLVQVTTERKLRPGDILVLDSCPQYFGYQADLARSASVGEPSKEVAEFYELDGQAPPALHRYALEKELDLARSSLRAAR